MNLFTSVSEEATHHGSNLRTVVGQTTGHYLEFHLGLISVANFIASHFLAWLLIDLPVSPPSRPAVTYGIPRFPPPSKSYRRICLRGTVSLSPKSYRRITSRGRENRSTPPCHRTLKIIFSTSNPNPCRNSEIRTKCHPIYRLPGFSRQVVKTTNCQFMLCTCKGGKGKHT